MVQVEQQKTTICPYAILGIHHGVSMDEIVAAYQRLIKALDEEKFTSNPQSWVQARQAYLSVENAYIRIVNGDDDGTDEPVTACDNPVHPKLGQMLVAEGLITLQQLEDCVANQPPAMPLGQVLRQSSLITEKQLDRFLREQLTTELPADNPDYLGQRLIGLGLVTQDMLMIALVEQRKTMKPLGQILVEHCWLAADILDALLEDIALTQQERLAAG